MSLTELRKQIDLIDFEMLQLFKKRMALSFEVGQYKKEQKLAVLDTSREQEAVELRKQWLSDDHLWPYYERFIKEVMLLSKEYQK